jgi:hypothetical protein
MHGEFVETVRKEVVGAAAKRCGAVSKSDRTVGTERDRFVGSVVEKVVAVAVTVMGMNYVNFVKMIAGRVGGFWRVWRVLEKQFCGWYFGGTWGRGR